MEQLSFKEFLKAYGTEDECLDEIFENRFGGLLDCPRCQKETNFYRVTGRKCYACQWCGFQLHPLAQTIFHKSKTTLTTWFFAMYLFSVSKNGVSAMELQRQTNVTYKTAWRMAKQIRLLMAQDDGQGPLSGLIEVDEAIIGGKAKMKDKWSKGVVVGMVERGGRVVAKVVPDVKKETLIPQISANVEAGSTVITDSMHSYKGVGAAGYKHETINHTKEGYVRGSIYTNTIENFWGQLKRSVNGTYHHVSKRYLQLYVSEFAYRYSNRKSETPLFFLLLELAGKPVSQVV